MRDRRRHPRGLLKDYCLLVDAESNVPFGEILEMSREGLRIQAGSLIAEMASLQCKLRLPRSVDGRNEIGFSAWCVWCERDADKVSYQAGLRITGISDTDAKVLAKFLQTAISETATVNNE